MKKNMLLSIAAISILSAQTFELHKGWNLIGINEVKQDGAYFTIGDLNQEGILTIYNPQLGSWNKDLFNYDIVKTKILNPGSGYWIKTDRDMNLSLEGKPFNISYNLKAGWNLLAVPDNSYLESFINLLQNTGVIVDTIYNPQLGSWNKDLFNYDIVKTKILNSNEGYWVKTSVLAGSATTKDGYTINLYSDKDDINVTTLLSAIPNYNLTDLANIQDLFTQAGIENIIVSYTSDGVTKSSSYINVTDNNFETILSDVKSDLTNTQATSNQTAIYVYGIESGGAPFALSNAKVYKYDPITDEKIYIGETSELGYLYISNINNGDKIYVEKDGYDPTIFTINTNASANYIFLSIDDGTGEYEGTLQENSGDNARILYALSAQLYDKKGVALITPTNVGLKYGAALKIKPATSSTLPDYNRLELNQTGYETYLLGSIKIYTKKPGQLVYGLENNIDDVLYAVNDGNINNSEILIGFKLNDTLNAMLLDENGNYDSNKISDFVSHIKLYSYIDGEWKEVNYNKELLINGFSNLSNEESWFFDDNRRFANVAIKISNFTKLAPIVAVYQKPLTQTPDLEATNYTLNIKVTDTNNEPIQNALVKIQRGLTNAEVVAYTDENGYATFNIPVVEGSLDNINILAVANRYYPYTTTISTNSLTDGDNNLTISLQRPPAYGTVKGEITDFDNNYISGAKVKLIYPIALGNVNKDVTKIIDNKPKTGIEVGFVPNAIYKWYIKVHSDNINEVANARVSDKRWVLVQQASASENGNFLPYEKIIAQALAQRDENDPEDVKIIPAAQFDIAVEVDHDVDGDGRVDFVELATEGNYPVLDGDFSNDVDNNYGRIIGYISTSIDVSKIVADSGGLQNTDNYYYAIGENNFEDAENADVEEDLAVYTLAPETAQEDDEVTDYYKFYQSSLREGYLFVQDDTNENGHDYNYTQWNVGIGATIRTSDGDKYVVLTKTDNGYKWVSVDRIKGDTTFLNNPDNMFNIQTSTATGISYDKIGRFISQNAILSKLAESLSAIADEAGITSSVDNPDNTLFEDGFNVYVIPITVATINSGEHTGTVVKMAKVGNIPVGGENSINNYIKLDSVSVSSPAGVPTVQTTVSDRVGLYQFSAVPLSYGQLNNSNDSLLRVEAHKLGYFDSAVVNVPEFTQDNTETAVREDVATVNMTLNKKPIYKVEVNVTDSSGEAIPNAVVMIDGIYNENLPTLEESESIDVKTTDLNGIVDFENVLGGRGSNRIVRVSVLGSNYIPFITTIRNLTSNKTLNVRLVSQSEIPDFAPRVVVNDYSIVNGNAVITLEVTDKEDGTTTVKAENFYVLNNNELTDATISKIDGTNNKFKVIVPLEVGNNEVQIEVANSKGIGVSSTLTFDYNPLIGTVVGKVTGFTDADNDNNADNIVVIDILDEDGNYLNSLLVPSNGEFALEDLEADKTYKLRAVEIQLTADNFTITKVSNEVNVTVEGGKTVNIGSLILNDVEGIVGEPEINFIYALPQTVSTPELNVSLTVSNYDKEEGRLGIVVNDNVIAVPNSKLAEQGNNSYVLNNFTINLRPGQNVIYAIAQNPDGSYQMTADIPVYYDASDAPVNTLTLNILDETNTSKFVPSYVDIFDNEGNLVDSEDSNGTLEVMNLLDGNYSIYVYPDDVDYQPVIYNIELTSSKEVNITLQHSEGISGYWSISSLDLNVTNITKNVPFTATVSITAVDYNTSNLTYQWYYSYEDENGTIHNVNLDCNTQTCELTIPYSGTIDLTAEVTDDQNNSDSITQTYYVEPDLILPPQIPTINEGE